MRLTIALLACVATPTIAASNLACYEEPSTRKTTCFDEKALRVNGETRASPLYSGGPNGVRPTNNQVIVNCAVGIMALQDRDGVIFGAGPTTATAVSKSLSRWMCEATAAKKDPKLRPLGQK